MNHSHISITSTIIHPLSPCSSSMFSPSFLPRGEGGEARISGGGNRALELCAAGKVSASYHPGPAGRRAPWSGEHHSGKNDGNLWIIQLYMVHIWYIYG